MTFGKLLRKYLKLNNMSTREFGKIAKISCGQVSLIMNDLRTPSLETIDNWSDILKLNGEKRIEFIDFAIIAHIPEIKRKRFIKIYTEYSKHSNSLS